MITSIASPKNLRIAGLAAGAACIAGAAVYITASAAGYSFGVSPKNTTAPVAAATPKPSSSTVCNEFISHFSSDLGVSQDKVNSAFTDAVGQTLADEVKAGTITQAQADKIKQRLAGKAPCALAGNLGGGQATGGGVYQQALLTAAASALGISTDTLKADLAKGMTLHQIADAQNPPVTEAQFRARLIAQIKPMLDKAVADKKITSAQEQKILTALQSRPIPFWDRPVRKGTATATPGA
ncbi:MAG TPA: hypothetical protein VFL29_05990 [Candidatus Dormibacteraeota bacterium]|nr:hypothetical protein [Candidatus Dormibacteraeota bacterium]